MDAAMSVAATLDAATLQREAADFLYHEAELLDDWRLHDWLTMLADELDYRIPVRVSRIRVGGGKPFSDRAYHMVCDRSSMTARISRFDTGFAWSEETASRTRRIVGNVRLANVTPEALSVRSNFHIARSRDDYPTTLITGERHDVLLRTSDGLRLRERIVLLDHTSLPTENLAIMF
jgi:3-phenylpropionate/cinnamic acid dioxygenase small subunit